jgi:hypothetical protein
VTEGPPNVNALKPGKSKGLIMPYNRKVSPRAEYRLAQAELIKGSSSLTEKYPKLKSLRVDLIYLDATGRTQNGGMKYKANLEHAKSRFCFNCTHADCVGGDYDLSEELSKGISKKLKLVEGELRCQGVRHNKERKSQAPCQSILRYKLTLGY